MLVMVVDGKGGGIGVSLIEKILECNLDVDIIGIGTNSVAMSGMNKLGVDCASGENPVVYNAGRADFIPVSYTHLDVYKRQCCFLWFS